MTTQTNLLEPATCDTLSQNTAPQFCIEPPIAYADVMTEHELIEYLRIPCVSKAANYRWAIDHLIRTRDLPCFHMCRKRVFSLAAVRQWVAGQQRKGAA